GGRVRRAAALAGDDRVPAPGVRRTAGPGAGGNGRARADLDDAREPASGGVGAGRHADAVRLTDLAAGHRVADRRGAGGLLRARGAVSFRHPVAVVRSALTRVVKELHAP